MCMLRSISGLRLASVLLFDTSTHTGESQRYTEAYVVLKLGQSDGYATHLSVIILFICLPLPRLFVPSYFAALIVLQL